MGKFKKKRGSAISLRENATIPLAQQIIEQDEVKSSGKVKVRQRREADDEYVDDKLSKRILNEAKLQQEELENEYNAGSGGKISKPSFNLSGSCENARDDDDDGQSEDEINNAALGDNSYYEDININEEDEAALAKFMSQNPPGRRTLADIIMEKITEKQTEIQTQMTDNGSMKMEQLDERLVILYKKVGQTLSKYRSGKIPKAFKMIPTYSNWEQVLYLTNPETWTAAALYQATRLFASNLNAKMAQRFYNLILLPRIRDDIAEFKRLNYHIYLALKKSLFKPAAFFKGILLPLCESGNCTLREALILSSVLVKMSIPMLHSAAAILKIAEMDYNGANSIFLKTLLDKKYALPYRVVDAVVFHFLQFERDPREMPVLWHQALLVFVQRYKEDVSSEQKDALLSLIKVKHHPTIVADVRRELQHSKCRDVQVDAPMNV